MRKHQQGLGLGMLLIVLVLVILVGIFAMKLIPAYIDYFKAKTAIIAIAGDRSKTGSVAEIRKAFDLRSSVDDYSLKADALEVTKEGGEVVISFSYRKEVPLFANIGFYVDFAADSKGR